MEWVGVSELDGTPRLEAAVQRDDRGGGPGQFALSACLTAVVYV